MKRLLIVLMLVGCAHAPPPKPVVQVAPPTPAEVVTAVKQRVEQWRQAYEVRSVDGLAQVYSQTADLEVTNQGRTATGWPAVKDRLTGFCTTMTTSKFRLDSVNVLAIGDGGAVVTASVRRTYGDGVRTIDETGTLTLVFRRIGAEWRIVTEHYSYAPPSS
jgi:ketosteroid isomerase-like protein